MDFSVIFQLRTKKFWWMDVIFYFVMSLFVATILSYLIFLLKNNLQQKDIDKETASLKTVGTQMQKDHEKEVLTYQRKLNDFSDIFKNHGFASQVFSFMEQETRPNIWFSRFQLQQKAATVDVSGEADDNDAFSRQVAVFETNQYIKNIGVLNSQLGATGKLNFNLALSLDSKIFSFTPDLQPVVETTPSIIETTSPATGTTTTTPEGTPNAPAKSNEKLIIIFKFTQPEANGAVNLKDNTVEVGVPFGTTLTALTPTIVLSPKATVSPDSGIAQDFTNPIVYKVTAEDGSTQDYIVSVKILPKVTPKPSQSNFVIIIIAILLVLIVAAAGIAAFILYKRRLNKKPQL
jgi:hypothetical protein